jgi:hypothetical protein
LQKQPYGYEYEGRLYVVYSVGKEDCGLSILPIEALTADEGAKPASSRR